ncbi:hypothetical protein HanHA300_Chr15g0550981 [Helianthus annuus]|nr:hypothetical protein HanHA300_Chr15g0550981 [Helianthus annuus]
MITIANRKDIRSIVYQCQPWTITLTGASVIAGSWLILHNIIATSVASVLIGTWWYIFLYSYPKVQLVN